MDLGEVVRSVNPELSLSFHEWGDRILKDPVLGKLQANRDALGARLLTREGYILLVDLEQKQAWINYQLALDHLALSRVEAGKRSNHLREHDRLLKKGLAQDKTREVFPIYEDQLAILDRPRPSGVSPR